MLSAADARRTLDTFFRRSPVADLHALYGVLETRSRMTVFRRLSAIGYLSSYSHSGRYYTLQGVPDFDDDGLWLHEGIGFSKAGTLKETVRLMVEAAEDGRTQRELQDRLRVRVHNPLHDLVADGWVGRASWGGHHLYVGAEPDHARSQLARRQAAPSVVGDPRRSDKLSTSVVIEVLIEVIHGAKQLPDPATVATRLEARGVSVTIEQVEAIFSRHQLRKKKVASRSPSSGR